MARFLTSGSRFCIILSTLFTIPTSTYASDFNIPFINAADLGNTYAGWAASATDASTTYSNPAGLVKINHPQIVAGVLDIFGTTKFKGTTNSLFMSESGRAHGTLGGLLPVVYVAKPITSNVVFGFGINAPFGLGSNYHKDSIVRYFATRSQIVVADVSPSLGFVVNDKFSVGLGVDVERAYLTLDNMYGLPPIIPDSEGQNHLFGTGVGYHAGALYQVTPATRLGISYNSQVMFHLSGSSEVYMPNNINFRVHQKASTALPSYAQASIYSNLSPRWAAMATVFYTHWSVVQHILLKNTVLPGGITTPVRLPFEYHNTVDFALGLTAKANEKWLLRTGVTFYGAPSNDRDRTVADPIGRMILVGLGAHYQYSPCQGYDIGYAHDFFKQTPIHTVIPFNTANGHSNSQSNIIGVQGTWDFA